MKTRYDPRNFRGNLLEALEKYSFPNKHKDIEEGLSDLQFSSSLNVVRICWAGTAATTLQP